MKETIHLNIDDTQQVLAIAKALSSEQRLNILKLLDSEVANISEIAARLQIPMSTAALHVKTLEEAGWFPVWNGRCMGLDETFLCNRATSNSKAIVVSERQLVGHLSFGQQNETMREYFLSHKEIFDLKF